MIKLIIQYINFTQTNRRLNPAGILNLFAFFKGLLHSFRTFEFLYGAWNNSFKLLKNRFRSQDTPHDMNPKSVRLDLFLYSTCFNQFSQSICLQMKYIINFSSYLYHFIDLFTLQVKFYLFFKQFPKKKRLLLKTYNIFCYFDKNTKRKFFLMIIMIKCLFKISKKKKK